MANRVGSPLDPELAARLRDRIRQIGAHRVVVEARLSPAALANGAAGGCVAASTRARLGVYLAGHTIVPPGGELGPGSVT